ncbi:hypothetical protein BZA70DRAFT_281092 [Myxozyma melibiosi]|uniref:Eukaryotic translation initiation factor 3 subunit A n=1 Tax=Myxozyma melibiosi TaxID=54550 RepID=A0ABR1F405_9ASCO
MAPHVRPENVLKRAEELLAVDQAGDALSLLHEIITSKRTRNTPIVSLEPIMLRFVELCVQLRKGKLAKEGLYTYKNVAQNTSVSSIEVVLRRFIDLSKEKVAEAQAQADRIALDTIDDLEASETPESIMLSAVSTEQTKDRTDRAVVTPWLKFLWEVYRTVLEILRNNARLEIMYQSTAIQAFQFCLKFTRKTEFRRLCELLRNHLQSAAKNPSQAHAINLNDPDTLQRHLDTRFAQLSAAVELELWQEAFRSVEDIHTLLTISKRPAKPAMMANYYEKLTKIFLVSDNFLFHAAAASRFYNVRMQTKALTEAEISKTASTVLLSALSIPVISTGRIRAGMIDVDENKPKNARLSGLLNLSKSPSRASLLREALAHGVLARVSPEIRELYTILEVDFHPLAICKKITPILATIAADEEMSRYIAPLHQVILTRLFQQLSQVYDAVKLGFVLKLVDFPEPFAVSRTTIEKFVMNGCKKGELAIRVNHAADSITFESDVYAASKATDAQVTLQPTPSEIIRGELSRVSKSLFAVVNVVDSEYLSTREAAKTAAIERAIVGVDEEHRAALERKELIETRAKEAETILQKREEDESKKRQLKQQQEAAAEQKRLADEMRKREFERVRREQEAIKEQEKRKLAEEIRAAGVKLDADSIESMDTTKLREVQIEQVEKKTKDTQERLRITAKRIDHLERAYRKVEIPLLEQDYEKQKATDLQLHKERHKQTVEQSRERFEYRQLLKKRLGRMVGDYEEFKEKLLH